MRVKSTIFAVIMGMGIVACDDSSSNKCADGETRPTSTVCGLNDEGFILQECVAGKWTDTTDCSGSDLCVNGATQNGLTVCGANDEGVLVQECVSGQWQDTTDCNLNPDCTNGETRVGTTACGLNDEGFLVQECIDTHWQDTTSCSGTDECEMGSTQMGSTVCGLNDEGFYNQTCPNGMWVDDTNDCTGDDACENGSTQEGTTVCGLNDEGFVIQDCIDGQWVDGTDCSGTDICLNSASQESTTVCGLNHEGFVIQDCINGQWVDGDCSGTDECEIGTTQAGTTTCGLLSSGTYEMNCAAGTWNDTLNCINEINVVINEIETGVDGYVELFNAGTGNADISGFFIFASGAYDYPPASTVLAPGEYYVAHFPALATTLTVSLSDSSNTVLLDEVWWTTPMDLYGRHPNGTGSFQSLYIPTEGAENTNAMPLFIDWCDVQSPQDYAANGGDTTTIYGQVYIDGSTGIQGNDEFPNPQVRSRLCWDDGTETICEPAVFNSGHSGDNNDEYMADLTLNTIGDYDYWYEFSGDLGNNWTTCAGTYIATINVPPTPCDVSGYTLKQLSSTINYVIPAGTIIPGGKTLLIVRGGTGYDQAGFETYWGVTLPAGTVYLDSVNHIPMVNGEETYELLDASMNSVDGPTIPVVVHKNYQRVSTADPAGTAASWTEVTDTDATPGSFTGTAAHTGHPVISEFGDSPVTYQYEFVEIYCD
ncbi:lamin tail domain-containing protein [Myxococcota bacterium]|nr:lamin tail domain-containing protein [Myxococcota bacterium]